MGKKIIIEVLGSMPPCPKCRKTHEVVEEAVKELGISNVAEILKLDAKSPEVISKYGIVLIPAVAVNNIIRISGRVPSKEEIKNILKEVIADRT